MIMLIYSNLPKCSSFVSRSEKAFEATGQRVPDTNPKLRQAVDVSTGSTDFILVADIDTVAAIAVIVVVIAIAIEIVVTAVVLLLLL